MKYNRCRVEQRVGILIAVIIHYYNIKKSDRIVNIIFITNFQHRRV